MVPRQAIADARKDALARYPEESCGFVVQGAYVPLPNTAEDPENNFSISAELWLEHKPVEAIIHSHTHEQAHNRRMIKPGTGLDAPSKSDMESQLATGVPWGIILTSAEHAAEPFWFGEHTLDEELKGRSFRHGVYDCYSLLRAYYWQHYGIKLPEFPRQDSWWDKGENLFLENFRSAGFRLLAEDEPEQLGDVILASVSRQKEPVVNHCGVFTGNGRVMHHLSERLSREDVLMPYMKFVRHWVRYEP